MATDLKPGTELMIIAAGHAAGSPFMNMLMGRDRRSFVIKKDPRKLGFDVGSWIAHAENGLFEGRIVSITDDLDPDDWFGEATEWYVTIERPWKQTRLNTTIGKTKIEWLEDQLFPRVGTVISCEPESYFRPGDIVRAV